MQSKIAGPANITVLRNFFDDTPKSKSGCAHFIPRIGRLVIARNAGWGAMAVGRVPGMRRGLRPTKPCGGSAADLKFPQRSQRVRDRDFKSKAALES